KMDRKIPATMATQHPDNAREAYWNKKKFQNTLDETEECYRMFDELKCTEYMWDWEGKFVDEAVVEKLFQKYYKFFKRHPLGKDVFLTFRIPNTDEESGYRLARAFMAMLTADDLAHEVGMHAPPVFEVILPMTTNAGQLLRVKKTFHEVAEFKRSAFNTKRKDQQELGVIPLFEGVEHLCNVDKVLSEYIEGCKTSFGKQPPYMRPFMARSDPALNAGLIPAVLSSKVALQKFAEIAKKYKVPMYPIIGPGCLPFRGGVNPETIADTIQEYSGIRTITIQSAFRYDYDLDAVKKAIQLIERKLPQMKYTPLSKKEVEDVIWVNKRFGDYYKYTIEKAAVLINRVAAKVPGRRERMLHIGLFGYSRGVGKVSLPRAIKFTGSLYSIGIPPEFIGSGRGIRDAIREGKIKTIEKHYNNLRKDFIHAGKYLNKENLAALAKSYPAFREVMTDVQEIENYLGVELGPLKTKHYLHRNLVSSVYLLAKEKKDFSEELEKAAEIRKSLG
ncbi:phosphoenolpyruvate carboxylase, partial [Candidatus Peregrinibacteria bacterium]|nr:phosphoenolpyruvate carboxylase [Candidatus Peregrinibacteria bacterium]